MEGKGFFDLLSSLVPSVLVLTLSLAVVLIARYFLLIRGGRSHGESQLVRQLLMFLITAAGVLAVILFLPIGDSARGQLLSLIGILLTGAIALSSTTFVGNAMAGLMLKAVGNIEPGDFLKVNGHVGRVSDQGLLHTEIQTEDRDLTTLPNLFLVTNPVSVVRSSGTVISATVSLGYDNAFSRIEPILIKAVTDAGLSDPFVQILELGDFSVQYRAAGFLKEVNYLLSARSRIRIQIMKHLHADGVEIVSPTFMNQRQLPEHRKFMAVDAPEKTPEETKPRGPEDVIFDKAEKAVTIEKLKERLETVEEEIAEFNKKIAATKEERIKNKLETQLELYNREANRIRRLMGVDPDKPEN